VWVTVILDEDNRVRTIRAAPDLSLARCVVGLDAHPSAPLWQRNTRPDITTEQLLDADERRLWRRFERGLTVVQVGEATRPLASGEYFDEGGTRAVLEHLHETYADAFRTVITASSVESRTKQLLREVGVKDSETMHYGEEKSRNDFRDETVGLVNGSIDPGDDYVLDLLAECGLDARPETVETEAGDVRRAHGREFVGSDAEAAREILASVRENHVAQAAGRYARSADDPTNTATVFVRTDAIPAVFADLQVPGVEWVATDTQRRVIEELRERTGATARELAEATGVTKRHVAKTLARLLDNGSVECREGAAKYGANVYSTDDTPSGVVSLGGERITNSGVWDVYTWAFVIRPVSGDYAEASSGSVGTSRAEDYMRRLEGPG
jgi:DNA-binding transcriptional ArsR family regulator